MKTGRTARDTNEHQSNPWQKIVGPAKKDELENEAGHPAWIRKYLDLADLLISRVQRRLERTSLRRRRRPAA
jgi:hypothetical protein